MVNGSLVTYSVVKIADTSTHCSLVVKIADFGVARVMVNDSLVTTTISGSPPYMSPEQLVTYICIYIERERKRERGRGWEDGGRG